MDITTTNTIIGTTLVFIGSCVLFVLGAILSYMRQMNRNMKEMYQMSIEHKVQIKNHGEWLEKLDDKVYKLTKAA